MVELYKQVVTNQFEAALAMFQNCLEECRPEHWEGKIANDSFQQVAYHVLFWVDFYLSKSDGEFQLRDFHHRGGDERGNTFSVGLSQEETLAYLNLCLEKVRTTLLAETGDSLIGPSGISFKKLTRAELHLYNLRHLQHHVGALSAYLRRVDPNAKPKWIGSGWK